MGPAEEFILRQQEPYKSILLHLQILIESAIPNIELKFKWKIPFYYLNEIPFCYLNVSKKKQFVDVAFWVSSHLTKHSEFLISENRKVVKSLRYKRIEDINETILLEVLLEAFHQKDKGFYKKK